ncbi:hypothetical protein LJC17_02650 [Acholeplasma sp. OttesenSCG-928-E16]|nr:hypothetical protein [Acholeplasma sp. OttesenSCG-928-E16]
MKINDLIINLKKDNEVSKKRSLNNSASKVIDINNVLRNSFIQKTNDSFETKEEKKSNLKIIGITGSRGKSTVAYLTHQYLKEKGYKSILYSSIMIDSKISYISSDEAVENPLRDERMLLDALTDAIEYDADFLILEVNEAAIKKGLTKNIPFDLRMITNIYPKHNIILYPDYVDLKKEFFKEVEDKSVKFIIGTSDASNFDELMEINKQNERITYSSKWVSEHKNIDVDVKFYSKTTLDTMNGLDITVLYKENEYDIKTSLLFPFNAENITGCVTLLEALNVYDYDFFKLFIQDIKIKGRDTHIKVNNSHIIISLHSAPHLELFKKYKELNYLSKIKVVTGETGLGHYSWDKEHNEDNLVLDKVDSIGFNMKYMNNNADFVYLTTSDSGATNKDDFLDYQASLLNVAFIKISDRRQAIIEAINGLMDNEVLFIYGRGNRRVMCDGYDSILLHQDYEVVKEALRQKEKMQ